jgi:hypothetical protein
MAAASSSDEYSDEYYRRGGVSLGGVATGSLVAIASTVALMVWGAAILDAEGYDLHEALRGELSWTSAAVGIGFVTAVFLSYLWGGYAAGRMGIESGGVNGALVALFTLLAAAAAAYVVVGPLDADSVDLPLGVGSLPLDGNFTGPGFGFVAAILLAMVTGAIWGGMNGSRWHRRVEDDYEELRYQITGTDSFSDLRS